MATTKGKKKGPPAFHYLPKSRAKQLRKSWIEDHKIRSRWKAQKKREGLSDQTSAPLEDTSSHHHDETNANSELDTSLHFPDKSPTATHDSRPLRDLRKIAYAANPPGTQKANFSPSKRARRHSCNNAGGKAMAGCETGQPNMKLRMNVLLEKIKRDFS